MTEEYMDLENFLQRNCGLKGSLYRTNPYVKADVVKHWWSLAGLEAYGRFTDCLHDVNNLCRDYAGYDYDIIDRRDVENIIETLDQDDTDSPEQGCSAPIRWHSHGKPLTRQNTESFMSLESFLQKDFQLKGPLYRIKPITGEDELPNLWTKRGMAAYNNFVGFLYDLNDLCKDYAGYDKNVICPAVVDDAIETLDGDNHEIINSVNCRNLSVHKNKGNSK